MKEKELQDSVFKYLRKNNKKVFVEIPFMSRIIDLVLIDSDSITAIELKTQNWKRAIDQLLENRIAADYCCLCMPKQNMSTSLVQIIQEEMASYGFGFFLWDNNIKEMTVILKGHQNQTFSKIAADKLIENIRGLGWEI
ncbi:hypothetical protein ACFLR7_07345 [Acidobacteriota bacterium]